MNGEINGTFIYNGKPQNGATAKLWQITGFASYTDSTDTVQDNPLTATSIELNVTNGGLFAVGDIIKIENELCRVWLIVANKLYIIRGYRATAPAAHAQTTMIYIETITEPAFDAAEPNIAYQQGGTITTAATYGGDGAYRWTAVPEGEYYVSVFYDAHRAWLYASVEMDDPTPSQLLRASGDLLTRDANGVKRLPLQTGKYLKGGATEIEYADLPPGVGSLVLKTADEVVNNNNTLQNDDHLFMAIAANEIWAFTIFINFLSGTTPDFKCALVTPAAATLRAAYIWQAATYPLWLTFLASGAASAQIDGVGTTDGTNNSFVMIKGYIINGANGGNLQLQWAQFTANATDTTVKNGSYIVAHKLA